jgi:hypothetical protein
VKQVNTYVFFMLGSRLQGILSASPYPIKTYIHDIKAVRVLLDLLLNGAATLTLNESNAVASIIHDRLLRVEKQFQEDGEIVWDSDDADGFGAAVQRFDTALALELGRAPIFYVSPKGISDVRVLITDAATIYEGYKDRLPKRAIDDTREAGRCLAFALPTAAGFHIARATETVMLKHMEVFHCPALKNSNRNWGQYTRLLRESGANPKVVHHLEQIRELHRNPLIHPEVTLTLAEALSLWALCTSVIQAMIADMETRVAAPSVEILGMLPEDGEKEGSGE